MPETEIPKNEFTTFVAQEDSSFFVDNPEFIQKIAGYHNVKLRGRGMDSYVVDTHSKRPQVAAVHYETLPPEEAKKLYWEQKILSTLFPHNFPKFYAAFGARHQSVPTGTIRQRIEGRDYFNDNPQNPRIFNPLLVNEQNRFVKHPLTEVFKAFRSLSCKVSIDARTFDNFRLGEDGGVYYLDKPHMVGTLDEAELLSFMSASDYGKEDQYTVATSIRRLAMVPDSCRPELAIALA